MLQMNSVSVNTGKNVSYTVIYFTELEPVCAILGILFISYMGLLCIQHTTHNMPAYGHQTETMLVKSDVITFQVDRANAK
jgi:hypothetical protein